MIGRKGLIKSLFFIVVFLFGLSISILIGTALYSQFGEIANFTGDAKIAYDSSETTITMWDYLFVIIFASLGIALVVSVLFIKSHPVYFIVLVFFLIIAIFTAGQITNMYEVLQNDTTIGNYTVTTYPMMTHIMNNLPTYLMIFGFIAIIVLIGIRKDGGLE